MNFLFRSFIFLGALVVVALFVALLAPFWIDWEQFTEEFETQASRVIGQPVKVGGKSSLRLLPLPNISFQNLAVGRNEDGTPLMTVERFTLDAELLPFLSGEVRIVDMTMVKPSVNLQVSEDGTIAWTEPKETLVNPEQVNIEKLTVQSGSLTLNGIAGGRTIDVENFNAELSARSILGPWRLDGVGYIDGVSSKLKLSTGTYQQNSGSIRLKVDASRDDQPYRLQADGPVSLQDNVLAWKGEFGLKPLASNGGSSYALPVEADGLFTLTPQNLAVPEYRLEIGDQVDPYVVTGDASAEIGKRIFFQMKADGRQVNLDRLEPSDTNVEARGIETRLAALQSVLDRIPVPNAEGEIDIILPALVAGSTFIRDVKAKVRPLGKGWDVRALQATFPGNTKLEANGRVGLKQDFGFAGRVIVASRQPSGFAAWLSGDVSPEIRKLKAVGLDAAVTISKNQATFEDVELRLDDAVLTGKLQRVAATSGKAAIIAELMGNRVNTDDLQALYSLARGEGEDLVSHDLNIRIKAEQLETRLLETPVLAKQADAHLQVRDGSVSVERFNAQDVFGASVTSTGRIEDVLSRPNGNMALEIKAENGSGFLNFLNTLSGGHELFQPFLTEPELSADTQLEIELDTRSLDEGAKGQLLAVGSIAGTSINSRLRFEGSFDDLSTLPINYTLRLANEIPERLLQQAGFELLPDELSGGVSGPLSAELSFSGTAEDGLNTQALLTSPGTSLSAQGTVKSPNFKSVDAGLQVAFASQDFMPYASVTGLRLPVPSDQAFPVSAKFEFNHSSEKSSLTNLVGQAMNNGFSGDLRLNRDGLVRPKVTGSLKADRVDLLLLSELALGRYNQLGIATEILPDGDLNFSQPLYQTVDAELLISGAAVSAGSVVTGGEGSLKLENTNGLLNLNSIVFDAFAGELSGMVSLVNSDGTAVVKGNLTLIDGQSEELLNAVGFTGLALGDVKLTATLEASGRSLSGLVSDLSGSGFAQFQTLEIKGIDPTSFQNILLQTDVEGFEINTQRVSELVDDEVLKDGFSVPSLDAPFSIARGVVKARNIRMDHDEAELSGNLEIGLLDQGYESSLDVLFKPGRRERVRGADPRLALRWSGPATQLSREIDASQLEGYLSLRAFEASQRRIELLEAKVIEKQRLNRQLAFAFKREQFEVRKAEEERLRLEELERIRLEEAARKLAEEQARLERERLEAERKRLAEEAEQQRLAEEAERKRVEEAARKAAEQARPKPVQRPAIESVPLEPLKEQSSNEQPAPITPSLRNNIIQNLENFLGTQ